MLQLSAAVSKPDWPVSALVHHMVPTTWSLLVPFTEVAVTSYVTNPLTLVTASTTGDVAASRKLLLLVATPLRGVIASRLVLVLL